MSLSPFSATTTPPASSIEMTDPETLSPTLASGLRGESINDGNDNRSRVGLWEYTDNGQGEMEDDGDHYAELAKDYWFQLADQYNVPFATARVLDLRSGNSLITFVLHSILVAGDHARPRLVQLADEFTIPEGLDPPALAPLQRLVTLAAPAESDVSIPEWLDLVWNECNADEALAYIMERHTDRESRIAAAFGLKDMLTRLVELIETGIAHIWETVERGGLFMDAEESNRLDHWLDYTLEIAPAIAAHRLHKEEKMRSGERVALCWGDGWMERLDPTGRWLVNGTVAFWGQLADVAESGATLGEVRTALDDDA